MTWYFGDDPRNPFADYVDDDTVLFWPLDDGTIPYNATSASNGYGGEPYNIMTSSIGGIVFEGQRGNTGNCAYNTPTPTEGMGCALGNANSWGGITSSLGSVSDEFLNDVKSDSWLWMGWYMPLSGTSSESNVTRAIFGLVGGSGTTDPASNTLFALGHVRRADGHEHDGKLILGWNSDVGPTSNDSWTYTISNPIRRENYGQWFHLAVQGRYYAGRMMWVSLYVNGERQLLYSPNTTTNSEIIPLGRPFGGDNPSRKMGVLEGYLNRTINPMIPITTQTFSKGCGAVWNVQWDTYDESGTVTPPPELTLPKTAYENPGLDTTSENTFFHCKFETIPDFRDYGPYGIHGKNYDVTTNNSPRANAYKRVDNALSPMTYGLQYSGNSYGIESVYDSNNAKLVTGVDLSEIFKGPWTIEFLASIFFLFSSNLITQCNLGRFGKKDHNTVGGSEGSNNLLYWRFGSSYDQTMQFSSHSGAGVLHREVMWYEPEYINWAGEAYWALTKELIGDGTIAKYKLYKNAVMLTEFEAPNATNIGEESELFFSVVGHRHPNLTAGYSFRFADYKISKITRDQEYFKKRFEKYYRDPKRMFQNIDGGTITYTENKPDEDADISVNLGEKYYGK